MQYQQPEDCPNCQKTCSYNGGLDYCYTHKIGTEDTFTTNHFCLEHSNYHCSKHWKLCCSKFGHSVMTNRPVTTAHLHKRAQEIIEEQDAEIKKLEAYMDQIKHSRFICSECRNILCICDISKFKRIERKRKVEVKKEESGHI